MRTRTWLGVGFAVLAVASAGAFGATGGGTITTIAGSGKAGFSGDGGPATRAQLSIPSGVAVDANGNVCGGKITTFAGTGGPGCGGFAIGPSIGDGRAATSAFLCQPDGLALDRQGNLYVTENGRARVRNVGRAPARAAGPSGSTRALRTFAGRIEAYLRELARGRSRLGNTLSGLFACSSSPGTAAAKVAGVVDNRQSILGRLGSLTSPTSQSAQIASLLKTAVTHSIAADRHYENWLRYLQSQAACSTRRNSDLAAAQREDRLATAAKRSFVAAFNPLARRLGLRTWSADEF